LLLLKRTEKVTSYGYRSNSLKSDEIRTVYLHRLIEKIDVNILSEENGFSCQTRLSEKRVEAYICSQINTAMLFSIIIFSHTIMKALVHDFLFIHEG
jgi:hypothetical protein